MVEVSEKNQLISKLKSQLHEAEQSHKGLVEELNEKHRQVLEETRELIQSLQNEKILLKSLNKKLNK